MKLEIIESCNSKHPTLVNKIVDKVSLLYQDSTVLPGWFGQKS